MNKYLVEKCDGKSITVSADSFDIDNLGWSDEFGGVRWSITFWRDENCDGNLEQLACMVIREPYSVINEGCIQPE